MNEANRDSNNLALFFTRGVSLETWVSRGLFDREKLLYEEHLKKKYLDKVFWFTYGSSDKKIADSLKKEGKLHKDIYVFQKPWIFQVPKIGNWAYSLIVPFIRGREIKQCFLLKSNQMDGSWSAIISSKLYRKPILNRTGFTLSLFGKRKGFSSIKQLGVKIVEGFSYKNADVSVVASVEDKEYLIDAYDLRRDQLRVIHNYIDTNLFKPIKCRKFSKKAVFIGRLEAQKNLFRVLKACSNAGLDLDIYGEGQLKDSLIKYSKTLRTKVNFMGIVNNSQLPLILNKYKFFILGSLYEGMPKTLLEAMACGCICIGTKVSGINEVIINGENGYLANGTDIYSLTKALRSAIKSKDKTRITENARETILENFSLEKIVSNERKLFYQLNENCKFI